VRGTVLGAADFTAYYASEAMGRFAIRDGKPDFRAPIARDQWRTLRAEDNSTPCCTREKAHRRRSISIRRAAPTRRTSRNTCGARP